MAETPILKLENTRNMVGATSTAWLGGRLEKHGINLTPALYSHSNGYDPRMALMIQGEQGKPDGLKPNPLIDNFKFTMARISHNNDAKSAKGELEQITEYYDGLRTGRIRHFRKEDILQAIDNIKRSYDKKYEDEESKKQRDGAYRQLRANLEQRLASPSLLRAHLKQDSPMKGKSSSEVTQGSVVTRERGAILSAAGFKADVICDGKSKYKVDSGPRASLKDRLAAMEKAVALTAADLTNGKGEMTGSISIDTDNPVIAESAYTYARRQGFKPENIKINCTNKEKPFVIRDDLLERNIEIARQSTDRHIISALKPEHPDRPDIPATESVGFESGSAEDAKTRKLGVRLPNQSPLAAALKNKESGVPSEEDVVRTSEAPDPTRDEDTPETDEDPRAERSAGAKADPRAKRNAGADGDPRAKRNAGADGDPRAESNAGADVRLPAPGR